MENYKLTPERIAAYGRYLIQEERAPATIEKYLRSVHSFAAWLDGRAVTKETVAGWKEGLLEEHRSPSTVNAVLSALNSLFRFLGWEGCHARFPRSSAGCSGTRPGNWPGTIMTNSLQQHGTWVGIGWPCSWRPSAPQASGWGRCPSSRWRPPAGGGRMLP